MSSNTPEQLMAENRMLREQLAEAREVIYAIRSNQVDALVVEKPLGDEVCFLSGAERLAEEAASIGYLRWAVPSGRVILSPGLLRICGLAGENLVQDYSTWQQLIHPEDQAGLQARQQEVFSRRRELLQREYRLLRADGDIRWVEERSGVTYAADGRPVRVIGVLADVTQRRRAEEELAAARNQAEEASRAKSQFLANMSHELRTPMNAIMGMTELALREPLSPTVRDCLRTAKESADSLLELLDQLLDFSRIEAGQLELETRPFDLGQTLNQVAKTFGLRAGEKGLELICDLPPDPPRRVVGDPLRLRQVLVNLVGNAIKFTDRGEVVIRAAVQGQTAETVTVEFSVLDTGIGIPPEDRQRIFSPFTQADASTTRHHGGSGLGLAIVSNLVDLMGGTIQLESEPGLGSRFTFALRFGLPTDAELQIADAAGDGAAQQQAAPRRALRLLLAEDTPANQKLVVYLLSRRGHTVEVAADGRQALDLAGQQDFDLVLMDVQMPALDGFQATQAIRALPGPRAHVPIVAMTAHALRGDDQRCLAAGMDAYLSKPVDADELINLVERLADQSRPAGDSRATLAQQVPAAESVGPEAAAAGLQPVFDLDQALAKCFGEYPLFQKMVLHFFAEADDLLDQMRLQIGRGDAAALANLAHRLKNTTAYLGAAPANRVVEQLERINRADQLPHADDMLHDLGEHLQQLKAALEPHRP